MNSNTSDFDVVEYECGNPYSKRDLHINILYFFVSRGFYMDSKFKKNPLVYFIYGSFVIFNVVKI